jgi:GST-like protein
MSSPSEYVPPRVWTWKQPSGGRFAHIKLPVSGASND